MFEMLTEEMKKRNFSPKTSELYVQYNRDFLQFIAKNPHDVVEQDKRFYFLHLLGKQRSSATIDVARAALDFYYGEVLGRKRGKEAKPQEKKSTPKKIDVQRLLESIKNPKYNLIISLLYKVRIGFEELVKIKIADVDYAQKCVRIRAGYGREDRQVTLTEDILMQIRLYVKNRPYQSTYLFASQDGHMTSRMVEGFLQMAWQSAGLRDYRADTMRQSLSWDMLEQRNMVSVEG